LIDCVLSVIQVAFSDTSLIPGDSSRLGLLNWVRDTNSDALILGAFAIAVILTVILSKRADS
jgi:hypothetical protein